MCWEKGFFVGVSCRISAETGLLRAVSLLFFDTLDLAGFIALGLPVLLYLVHFHFANWPLYILALSSCCINKGAFVVTSGLIRAHTWL
jgi:hypothetical protein